MLSLSGVSCNGDNSRGDETGNTKLDSVSDVGSDGLGREIDTVSEIERDVRDDLNEEEVRP